MRMEQEIKVHMAREALSEKTRVERDELKVQIEKMKEELAKKLEEKVLLRFLSLFSE